MLISDSKRVEKQIKDAEDKSDELKGHVNVPRLESLRQC